LSVDDILVVQLSDLGRCRKLTYRILDQDQTYPAGEARN
jgi:hypothetical protein